MNSLTARISVLAVGVSGLTMMSIPAASTVAAATSATGRIAVHAESPDGHHVGRGFQFCATTVKAPNVGKVEGKCGTTNSHGVATLRKVPVGKRYYTLYSSGKPARTFGKAKVTKGHTTKVKVILAG
jgi:hypothetical protein